MPWKRWACTLRSECRSIARSFRNCFGASRRERSYQFLKNGYPQPTELRWRHMNSVFRRCEWVFSQTYLLGRVVKYAQRTQEILFHLRKKRLDSLRRAESVSGILQEFANSSLPARFGSLARLRLPGLSSRRPVSGSRVFHRGGSGSEGEHSVPDPQRSGPTAAGSERFPASGHAENFLAAFRSGVLAEPASGPRQTSVGIVPSPGPPLQRDRRCRYNDPHDLWVPRRRGS